MQSSSFVLPRRLIFDLIWFCRYCWKTSKLEAVVEKNAILFNQLAVVNQCLNVAANNIHGLTMHRVSGAR